MSDVTLTVLGPDAIDPCRDEIARVHQAAFGKDDAYREAYRDVELPEMAAHSGFRCVVAHDQCRLAGFALGYDAMADLAWYRNVAAAVRGTPVASWLASAWYLGDIAVLPERQRKGVGGRLHDQLVGLVPGRNLVLITFHGDHPAVRFHARHGWRLLDASFAYRPGAPPTTLMGRPQKDT